MTWHPSTMARLTIPAAIQRATAEELAALTGQEADQERALRAKEAACNHARTKRLGRSTVLVCSACGSQWRPDAPASDDRAPIGATTPAPPGGGSWADWVGEMAGENKKKEE